jgi:8-hydroxy-5-deazaflavin:NADPH oxidoreductase
VQVRIGIVGTGNMGRALRLRWAEAGHEICFGARRREAAAAAAALSSRNAVADALGESARFGPAVLWTVPDQSPGAVVGDPALLAERVVIDVTNGPALNGGGSRAQTLAAEIPGARVVKAFNTSSFESLQLTRDEARAAGVQTLLAGDDPEALDLVAGLAKDIGVRSIVCGGLADAADVEAIARVLIAQIVQRGEFLLHMPITRLPSPAHPGRLGERSGS